jgi:hypothetical protein
MKTKIVIGMLAVLAAIALAPNAQAYLTHPYAQELNGQYLDANRGPWESCEVSFSPFGEPDEDQLMQQADARVYQVECWVTAFPLP